MGDEQKLSPDEQIALAREQFENATDLTMAVEEEFAILDSETLDLTDRFEEVQAAAPGTPLEEHLVGELIASEVEIRTGRCETFADVPATMAERRGQLQSLVEPMGILLGATGTHPWADWKEQRIIDTPHYRRNDELLRYVVWRNNTFGLHVHVAIRGADRAIAVMNGMRNFLPEILALSASSPFVDGVNTGLHTARTQIFTRFFPRCGVPDVFSSWAEYEGFVRFLYDTGSITEHTQIWWSVRPHLAFPTVESPDRGRAARPRRGAVARGLRRLADGEGGACPRRGTAGRGASGEAHRGELLARDPLRALRGAHRLRSRRADPRPPAPRGADRVGDAGGGGDRSCPVPRDPRTERGGASDRALRGRRDAPGDLRRAGAARRRRSVAEETPADGGLPTEEELRAALDQVGVSDVLLNALSATASLGFRRVSAEARDLSQARLAIEALRALEPVLRDNGVDEAVVRDLEQARLNLQLAYAKAVEESGAGG